MDFEIRGRAAFFPHGLSWLCRQKDFQPPLLETRSGTVLLKNIQEGFLSITHTFGSREQERAGLKDGVFVFGAVHRSKRHLILCALANVIWDVQRLFGSGNARPGCGRRLREPSGSWLGFFFFFFFPSYE